MYSILAILAICLIPIVYGLNRLADLSVFGVGFLIFMGFFAGLVLGFAFDVQTEPDDLEDSGPDA